MQLIYLDQIGIAYGLLMGEMFLWPYLSVFSPSNIERTRCVNVMSVRMFVYFVSETNIWISIKRGGGLQGTFPENFTFM